MTEFDLNDNWNNVVNEVFCFRTETISNQVLSKNEISKNWGTSWLSKFRKTQLHSPTILWKKPNKLPNTSGNLGSLVEFINYQAYQDSMLITLSSGFIEFSNHRRIIGSSFLKGKKKQTRNPPIFQLLPKLKGLLKGSLQKRTWWLLNQNKIVRNDGTM